MKIIKNVIDKIIEHAQKGAPLEVCGYLAGAAGVVSKHFELINIDHSEEHFSFDPKEQFACLKQVRQSGLELMAVYHSHPATAARPSQEDIRLAFDPNISYVIVSLADGKREVKSFKIKNGVVEPELVEMV